MRRHLRKGLFCNGEQMRSAIRSLLAGIDLHHSRHIEGVDSREGIGCNEDNARVCVDLLLQIAQLDGLEHCMLSVCFNVPPLLWYAYQRAR